MLKSPDITRLHCFSESRQLDRLLIQQYPSHCHTHNHTHTPTRAQFVRSLKHLSFPSLSALLFAHPPPPPSGSPVSASPCCFHSHSSSSSSSSTVAPADSCSHSDANISFLDEQSPR
ncbi:hypothetical protein AMECASPLE_016491 [Ameca splendens]|uniref:Uncharacterized protein n=1 Tax=Ameca splendens TaxID=208324 RepID=A0ABV0ZP54_9TELE